MFTNFFQFVASIQAVDYSVTESVLWQTLATLAPVRLSVTGYA